MDFGPDTAWPPIPSTVGQKLDEWGAWYSGDVTRLDAAYSRIGSKERPSNRPSQHRGGVVGAISRFFWGQPTTFGNPRSKLHVPLAVDIAGLSADLLFGEEVGVLNSSPEFDKVLEANRWSTFLSEAAHACAGLGGVYLRASWNEEIAPHVLFDAFHADQAIPEWHGRHLKSVTFWEQLTPPNEAVVVRYLETHQRGAIRYRLFEGDRSKLGRLVPLADPRWPWLAEIALHSEDTFRLPPGLMTATYVPNVRPAPLWRDDPMGRNLGVADIDQAEGLLDAIDETWSSWMRDIRHGKSRILIARQLLDSSGPGNGASFDMDREVFESLNFAQGQNTTMADMITPQQFTIRVEEHRNTIHDAMVQAVQSAGYSPYSFGLGAESGGTTATEVDSRDSKTRRTRERKTRYWTPALGEFLRSAAELQAFVFSGRALPDLAVEFVNGDVESPREVAQTLQMLSAAQATSVKTRVEMLHPEWDEAEVQAEVDLILGENRPAPITVGSPFAPDEAVDQGDELDAPPVPAADEE